MADVYEVRFAKAMPGEDLRARFEPREGSSDLVVLEEVWKHDVYRLAGHRWTSNAVVVDVGANCGAFTVAALELGAGYVVAIEPDPENFAALERNVALWREDHPDDQRDVRLLQMAASVEAGRGTVHHHDGGGGSWFDEDDVGPVEVVALRDLPELADVPRVNYLKVDTEGGEYLIVAGMGTTLKRKVQHLGMEYHRHQHAQGGAWVAHELWPGMVADLAEFFALELVGRPSVGGMLFGTSYT